MTMSWGPVRDDRVLSSTRALSVGITPFLLLGFVVLYLFPGDTQRLFAWTIKSTMTSMMLASAYLGGAYFFLRVVFERQWHVVRTGFLAVALFATLLGVATVLHWDVFHHGHVAFWVWTSLYFAAPFLVVAAWLANRRFCALEEPGEERLTRTARWAVGLISLLALVQGVIMFVVPGSIIRIWPWPLTPLTCRVLGAIFCLGCAGLVVLVDARWTTLKVMLQVGIVMIGLMLVASLRARHEFYPDRPLTWLLLAGFVGVLVASALLWLVVARRQRRRPRPKDGPLGGPTSPPTASPTADRR
jgi:hypothetical protein